MSLDIVIIICTILSFIPAIVFHEVMHGYAAYRLGDPTAKNQGRLTLNPIKHVDPFGTVILPAILMLSGGPVFGYAKPVPYNPRYFEDPRKGDLIVGFAGPSANFALALLGGAIAWLLIPLQPVIATNEFFIYAYYLFIPLFVRVNLYLMFFNLLPIPPLDGSSIFAILIPSKYLPQYYQVQRYALPIFFIIIFALPYILGFNIISLYLNATAGTIAGLILPTGLL